MTLVERLRTTINCDIPMPGGGETAKRHRLLMEVGRQDLSLARLAEAHWDAVAILAEAGREALPGLLYGVWASERPGQPMVLASGTINGQKQFCSGAGLIDRALVTVGVPQQQLVEVDLHRDPETASFDYSAWKTAAFLETQTATVLFIDAPIVSEIGESGWYLKRPSFWHGACGPASCWAGGALGLVDYAARQPRRDPHSLAHFGAMQADAWALRSYLDSAGREIDAHPLDADQARTRALTVRHLVEQTCTDILRRVPRAYGPHPLALDADVSRLYQELDLYLRQSHAERDLEALGRDFNFEL